MKRYFIARLFSGLGLAALAVFLMPAVAVEAATIGISPVRQELLLNPGDVVEDLVVTVHNKSDEDFYAQPNHSIFIANSTQGGPVYSTDPVQIDDLLSWIEITDEPVLVPANSTTDVPFSIRIPDEELEPGGRYILVGFIPEKENEEGAVKVNVRAAMTLIITIDGEIVTQGEVDSFNLPEELLGDQRLKFDVVFNNIGNIHVKPTGWIELENLDTGETLDKIGSFIDPTNGILVNSDKIPINIQEGNVLPSSDRIFSGLWTNNIENGNYRATLNMTYAEGADPITQMLEFELNDALVVDDFQFRQEGNLSYFELIVSNTGNVNQKLDGFISVKNSFDLEKANIPLPLLEEQEYIKPGDTKKFEINWLETELPKESYAATLEAIYGFSDQIITAEISFGEKDMMIIYLTIALGVLVLLFIVIMIIVFSRRKKSSSN